VVDLSLRAALVRGRLAVDGYVAQLQEQGSDTWLEEHATERLYMAAWPYVRWVAFNRQQEGVTGADWLWWWVDSSGECFGVLVQAKILKRKPRGGWSIDFLHRGGEQMDSLLQAADYFQIPAAYVLYCGNTHYRRGLTCGSRHTPESCLRCERAGVSIVSALIAKHVAGKPVLGFPTADQSAQDAFHWADPVEDLAMPSTMSQPILDLNMQRASTELRAFLAQEQRGVRHVARLIFSAVSRMRTGQFALSLDEKVDVGVKAAVFGSLPTDSGHFGRQYFPHILRGLRKELPAYVTRVFQGEDAPAWAADRLAGIVLVELE
jgi:hypothetical protein